MKPTERGTRLVRDAHDRLSAMSFVELIYKPALAESVARARPDMAERRPRAEAAQSSQTS
jgi:hypothetical protein